MRYYQGLARADANYVNQYVRVTAIDGVHPRFTITTHDRSQTSHTYQAANVVIATGYFDTPNLLGIPGEDLPKVAHNYREGHVFYDQDCIVVGGGNSAVDAALELHKWGARVTIVHFGPELDPNVKPWVRPDIDARLREGAIQARFSARLAEITPDSVLVRHEDGSGERLPNDWVLAMTGYQPDNRFLLDLGVTLDPETGIPHHDPETMQTNVSGVYLAGVLAAGFNANKVFIENGRDHGPRIARALTRAR